MKHRFLLGILAGLYPALFFASVNWYLYSPWQVALLIATIPLAIGIATFFFSSIFRGLTFLALRRTAYSSLIEPVTNALHAGLAISLCVALFAKNFKALQVPIEIPIAVSLALILFATWQGYRGNLKRIIITLLLFSGLTLSQWGVTFATSGNSDAWNEVNRDFNDTVQLTKKPNIYFIISEAHPSQLALKQIYHFDNSDFYNALTGNGFELYHDAFSSYAPTLFSLSGVFSMEHHYYDISLGVMDSIEGRHIVAGLRYNAVLDILRRNGYLTQYIHQGTYLLRQQGDLLDYTWPQSSSALIFTDFLPVRFLTALHLVRDDFSVPIDEVSKQLAQRLNATATRNQPQFTFIYLAAPGHSYRGTMIENSRSQALNILGRFRQTHHVRNQKANRDILQTVNQILESDKDALIVVSGDHGAYGHRAFEDEKGNTVSQKTLSLDRLGILMAIRFPDGHRLPDAEFKANINLFRYIFAHLSEDDSILKTRVPDDGYIEMLDGLTTPSGEAGVVQALKDGHLLDDWVRPKSRS